MGEMLKEPSVAIRICISRWEIAEPSSSVAEREEGCREEKKNRNPDFKINSSSLASRRLTAGILNSLLSCLLPPPPPAQSSHFRKQDYLGHAKKDGEWHRSTLVPSEPP